MLPDHDFVKPRSLAAAAAVLASETRSVKLIAGGTDVVFNMRGRLFEPDVLLSLRDLAELQAVTSEPDVLIMGAGCRLTDLEHDARVARVPGLAEALRAVASRHVRNMATLGGNLNLDTRCWYTNQSEAWREAKGPCLKTHVDVCHAIHGAPLCVALNASDVAPALIALDAEVDLLSAGGIRRVRLADYYTDDGVRHTVRKPEEIMVCVRVPLRPVRAVYHKETARKGNDFAYASIAVAADGTGHECSRIRIVLGSLSVRPVQLIRVADVLCEEGLGDAAIDHAVKQLRGELGVLTNLYTPAAYKSRIAHSLLRSALVKLRSAA